MAQPDGIYAYRTSECLVESLLGRRLFAGQENQLMNEARAWLKANGCPQTPNKREAGRYLVPHDLAKRFAAECWPDIRHLARRRGDIEADS